MQRLLFIGLAGFVGTVARYLLASYFARQFGETFPVGTLAVNTIGCFLGGLLFAVMQSRMPLSDITQAVLVIGFLGGFTTFSSFGLQTFALIRNGEILLAALNVVAANLLGLLMVWAGYVLGKLL